MSLAAASRQDVGCSPRLKIRLESGVPVGFLRHLLDGEADQDVTVLKPHATVLQHQTALHILLDAVHFVLEMPHGRQRTLTAFEEEKATKKMC